MRPQSPSQLAGAYGEFLNDILEPLCAAEDYTFPEEKPPLGELEVQALWHAGLLGNEGETQRHGHVHILDFGEWNRGAGPDFTGVELELDGKRVRGDIEIDPAAQDWERHGHGINPLYNRVALHVVLSTPPAAWFTRDSMHKEVPVLYIPPSRVRAALGLSPPIDADMVHLCRRPLAEMSTDRIENLLQAAAAHRVACKRKRFYNKVQALGERQAWYEAWAETLGYSANKETMVALARRAPFRALGKAAESILFGTAGFLVPMLPDKATDEARLYHRQVWDIWWQHKEKFSLSERRALPWALVGQRPLNHPHRRVAALAASVNCWQTLEPLFNAASALRLAAHLEAISHPFWDFHCTFNSAPLSKRAALVGRERIFDFLVNHVYIMDESPEAWNAYLSLRSHDTPTKVIRTAKNLFGDRSDLARLLRHSYAQQGLLQIRSDFCSTSICKECLFPAQLQQWGI